MPSRVYNNFTAWVQQDDFFTNWANFIEHKNIDGLRDGYGVTLWPKMNKQVLTNDSIVGIDFEQRDDKNFLFSLIWGANGEVYYLNSTDKTPEYVIEVRFPWNPTAEPVAITNVVLYWPHYYVFYKKSYSEGIMWCARISESDVLNWNFTPVFVTPEPSWWPELLSWFDLEFIAPSTGLWNAWIPPILVFSNLIYFGSWSSVRTINAIWLDKNFWFPWDTVTWITLQGSTIVLYTRWGIIYFWDGVDTTYQAIKDLKTRISKVTSKGGIDYVTTEDGQFYMWSGLSFQRVTKQKKSNRMDDNSTFNTRLDFSIGDWAQNRSMCVALDDVYMYANDTIPWIYKYGVLTPGMQAGLHKIITENHAGTPIDYIYDMRFYERGLRRLYISYKAGNTYWVDYIDLDSLETSTDGYMITEVFSWGTSFKKKLERIRRATSNTAWNNFIKLYYRVNNKEWILIRNINDAENEIKRENIHNDIDTKSFEEFIDIQMKIELHNDDWWENAPTLHELMQDYEPIET